MKIYYNHELKKLAQKLRNQSTLSEVLLWRKLRARQVQGYQFARQKPIRNYIVDCYCSKLKLVIEIDAAVITTKRRIKEIYKCSMNWNRSD